QILCPPSGQTDFTTTGGSANESIQETQAVFASVDYALDDQWTLSGGLRYTRDENIQVDGSDFGYGPARRATPRVLPRASSCPC
ncbi:MAG: TonB-dependent receptor, partial [Gammaproteobacteria bacterium]|nr:TonB-dependent receptor [Gammaproteobacteria bacterium]